LYRDPDRTGLNAAEELAAGLHIQGLPAEQPTKLREKGIVRCALRRTSLDMDP
jgi:hypothetical protein